MATHPVNEIRNVAVVGHTGAGKTMLGEAILHQAGIHNRLGSVDDGTSMIDADEEARERKHTVDSTVYYVEHDGKLINLIDTPGTPDYCGQAIAALTATETALVVISAASGIGVNTRRMFKVARERDMAIMVAITKCAHESADKLASLLAAVKEEFGSSCHPINLPSNGGKEVTEVLDHESGSADFGDIGEAHTELIEAIVETDEELMNAYMEGGAVSRDKLMPAIGRATAAANLIPVMFVDSVAGVGVKDLLDAFVVYAPDPAVGRHRKLTEGEGEDAREHEFEVDPNGDFIAKIFKITSDPKSNIRYSVARVFSGTMRTDGDLHVSGAKKGSKPGHIYKMQCDGHDEIEAAVTGDIIALPKLDAGIGTMLFDKERHATVKVPKYPTPMTSLALEPASRGDVEKIGQALGRFAEEDPCFEYHRDAETGELVMSGMGDQHLAVIRSKMKRYFKVEIETKPPKIPYRETISGSVKGVEYTHKKQSGGAGQFARVFIDMEPLPRGEGYEFEDKIFGGAIDQSYRPSVDKGVREQMKRGVIAGCPVVDVKVALVDGKTHPVDSKDIAFQIAGKQAFKKAFAQCKPILLEPVVHIEITAPGEYMGEITRDLAGKRGQIEGQDSLPGGQVVIKGTVPLGEVAAYSSQLKSATGGQGSYVMEFSHYDVVPPNVQQQIVASYKSADEDED